MYTFSDNSGPCKSKKVYEVKKIVSTDGRTDEQTGGQMGIGGFFSYRNKYKCMLLAIEQGLVEPSFLRYS